MPSSTLNTFLAPGSNWTLAHADAISDTGWVSGLSNYDADGTGSQQAYGRLFSILIPQAGTYGLGDANFDGMVNFDDLIILAQHYNQTNASKAINVGDFNLDGSVNFDDLIVLAQNYNKTGTDAIVSADASFASDWALAQSLVPEPATLAAIAWVPLMHRRRLLT